MNVSSPDPMSVPPPSPFINPPPPRIRYHDEQLRLEITQFLQAYNDNPSQYNNKDPIDLIHQDWVQHFNDILKLATQMGSIDLYQFILDTGLVEEISNRRFLSEYFYGGLSPAFTKYFFDLYPNRINLLPPNVLLSLFIGRSDALHFDTLQIFWVHCPQLKNQAFLNSQIRMPPNDLWMMVDFAEQCLNDGGYNGDLSSLELEDKYRVSFSDAIYIINFLLKASTTILQSFIENTEIDLAPIYHAINPAIDSQDSLGLLDDISGAIEQFFCVPMRLPLISIESISWYLNWWKNDVLGDSMSLNQFKTFILSLLGKLNARCSTVGSPCIEYLGDEFFDTLSPDQIFSCLNDILMVSSEWSETFPLLNTLLALPSVANKTKAHCVHFTRAFLRRNLMWDCAELFLKLGGLTMKQIWSDHGFDDDNGDEDVFTLKTILPSPSDSYRLTLPTHFVTWLSYQPGTQEQLIKMVQSKQPLFREDENTDLPESLYRLFLFMSFSYDQQMQRQCEGPEPEQEHLNLFPSSKPKQSLSWLQSLIVYSPIDFLNVVFTPKLWRSTIEYRPPISRHFVGKNSSIGLCILPILINETEEDNSENEEDGYDNEEDGYKNEEDSEEHVQDNETEEDSELKEDKSDIEHDEDPEDEEDEDRDDLEDEEDEEVPEDEEADEYQKPIQDEWNKSPAVLLEDIIQAAIAALLLKKDANDQ